MHDHTLLVPCTQYRVSQSYAVIYVTVVGDEGKSYADDSWHFMTARRKLGVGQVFIDAGFSCANHHLSHSLEFLRMLCDTFPLFFPSAWTEDFFPECNIEHGSQIE
jgi:hypothetical protein